MLNKIFIFLAFLLLTSCGKPISKESLANKVFNEIECPKVHERFASIKVCAISIEIKDTISYNLSIAERELIHFEKEFPDSSLMLSFLRSVYCEGVSTSLGIDWTSIAGAQIGVIQSVMDANGIYDNSQRYKDFPKNIELKYEVSTKNNLYRITRKPVEASLLGMELCDIDINPIDTNDSSI